MNLVTTDRQNELRINTFMFDTKNKQTKPLIRTSSSETMLLNSHAWYKRPLLL